MLGEEEEISGVEDERRCQLALFISAACARERWAKAFRVTLYKDSLNMNIDQKMRQKTRQKPKPKLTNTNQKTRTKQKQKQNINFSGPA